MAQRVLVGTAGHIDHGKSALVKALTGTDPDRLPQEKERGITIDLGFAHASWEGTVFSFVDVPGHEKFVRTMVAGAQGVDLVLFVIASDDSVMPQTREHLAILSLLDVRSGVIARSKSDLVDAETGALVEEEIRDLAKGTFLEGAPLLPVSAVTGAGIPALKAALAAAAGHLDRSARDRRLTRLFLDRAFTMKGFGPVVTGTLDGGRIAVDDRLTLLPEGREVRVRRVEVHGEERREAFAGERTSLNLAGIERSDLRRGQALVPKDALRPATLLTVEAALLAEVAAPLPDGTRVRVHHGTADVAGKIHLLPGSGTSRFAQLVLESPLPARPGDRFILRRPSPVETLGGGRVLDTGRLRIRKKAFGTKELVEALALLAARDEARIRDLFLREAGAAGFTPLGLGQRLGVPESVARDHLEALCASGAALRLPSGLFVHARAVDEMARRAAALFAERKASGAASISIARGEFLEKLGRGLPRETAEGWIALLEKGRTLSISGDRVAPPGAAASGLSTEAEGISARVAEAYRSAFWEPPKSANLAPRIGAKPQVIDGLVGHLIKTGLLVRIAPDLVVHRDVLAAAEKKLDALKGQTVPVAAFRDLWGLTRKTLIPLLEYLDGKKKTRRVGDLRKVE
ncbi:MAG: selenocysteine-specific translation elongation factor [Thermoanaerobaculia bacterium]